MRELAFSCDIQYISISYTENGKIVIVKESLF